MSTGAAAPRDPRRPAVPREALSAVPMGVLLAAGAAATAVSTPPAHARAGQEDRAPAGAGRAAEGRGPGRHAQAAPEPEAA
ncbi:hypothetical protein HYE82_31630 [Streptomyces sp. BR123]|uniref:hypothetical protein n=1 Tax=Streptomyces sp. BR123 TaxID=2749828 RepID=UPI0015C4D44B|nr:hypothetical protein [Streptomyces sp. BR123]NXY98853.1 hypothetical protein [Streptomyces sp. BR123]